MIEGAQSEDDADVQDEWDRHFEDLGKERPVKKKKVSHHPADAACAHAEDLDYSCLICREGRWFHDVTDHRIGCTTCNFSFSLNDTSYQPAAVLTNISSKLELHRGKSCCDGEEESVTVDDVAIRWASIPGLEVTVGGKFLFIECQNCGGIEILL